MQRISVNLQIIAVKINLTITMTQLQLEARIMHYKNLSKQIFWHSNRQREIATAIRHLLSDPKHLILRSNIFFFL